MQRFFIRFRQYVPAILILSLLVCSGSVGSQDRDEEPVYVIQHGWPTLPAGMIFGAISGVDVDSHGHVFTFHTFTEWEVPFRSEPERSPAIQVWDSRTGEFLESWGENFFRMPHGLSIDADDNVWVTDVAHNQVFKFTHDGQLLLTLGERGVEGSGETHFAQPTDVEFGRDGSFYVSDGYVNRRVVSFAADGAYRFEWGAKETGSGDFSVVHDLAVDNQWRVYVADRENDRIQIFEPDGTFVSEWSSGGKWRPYGIDVDQQSGRVYVIDGGEQPYELPYRSAVVILDSTGKELKRLGQFGNRDGEFIMGHDIALDGDGNILVADVLGRRLQRFIRTH
jgi:peptidylamidoglycolate lyase